MTRLILVGSIVLIMSGCLAKKKVAEAIDAAPAPDPAAAVADADAGAVAAADVDAALAPLAPLTAVKPVNAVRPKPAAAAAPPPNPDAPNCANARLFCNHPQVGTNPKIKAQCASFSSDCLKAGGKV